MGDKQLDWVRQARLDLVGLTQVRAEVESLIDRIEVAIVNLDSEAHNEAIADWVGMED